MIFYSYVSSIIIFLSQDWQNTQFLHVFQEQLITGERVQPTPTPGHNIGLTESHRGPMVDLQTSAEFEEPFYLVVLERTHQGTTVHMWRLLIASQPDATGKYRTAQLV